MKQILSEWDKTPRGTKVTLKTDYKFKGITGNNEIVPQGSYYIVGFWANACGLSIKHNTNGQSNYFIPSVGLRDFWKGD